jgi:hypothetical protein
LQFILSDPRSLESVANLLKGLQSDRFLGTRYERGAFQGEFEAVARLNPQTLADLFR